MGAPPTTAERPGPNVCEECGQTVEAVWLPFGVALWYMPRLCGRCLDRQLVQQRRAKWEIEVRDSVRRRLVEAGLGQGRREKTFAAFQDRPGTEEAVQAIRALAESLAAGARVRRGVFLVGENGSGKTHLGAAALNHAMDANPGLTGLFVEFADYLAALREGFRDEEDSLRPRWLRGMMAEVDLLVLDDLGVAAVGRRDWDVEELVRLLNRRVEAGRPTIVTADLEPDELRDRLGQRVVSRLYEACRVVPLEARDYRREAHDA